jgi:hypothetical protein
VEGKSLQDVMMDERILKKLLKAGHFEDYIFHDTSEGSPQGNSVSPSLATMTLNNLERDLGKEFLTTKYIDDFIVAGNSPEERGVAYHPNGLSFEKKLKWTELFGQFKDLDRKVCFAALILGKTSEVVDNILENNPEIDFQNLQRDIKKGLSDYDFLSGADIHYQHWFNLQDAYGDWRTVEEDRDLLECVPARIGIEEADDFGYSSINCAFLKGSETLLDLMASTNVVWDSEEVFKQRILDAYERHE